jgi:hypothetical protein
VMAGNSQYVLPDVPKVGKRVVNSVSPRNFGPRLGLTWSPIDSGRLVLRGGYGIFFSEPPFFYLAWDYFSPPFYQNFFPPATHSQIPFPACRRRVVSRSCRRATRWPLVLLTQIFARLTFSTSTAASSKK